MLLFHTSNEKDREKQTYIYIVITPDQESGIAI